MNQQLRGCAKANLRYPDILCVLHIPEYKYNSQSSFHTLYNRIRAPGC